MIIGVAAVFLVFLSNWSGDTNWPPWCALTALAGLTIAGHIYVKRIPKPLLFMFVWVLISGLALAEFRPALEGAGAEIAQTVMLRNLAMQALLEFLLLSFALALTWQYVAEPLFWGFLCIGYAHGILLFVDQAVFHLESGKAAIGLMGNRSIGASFMVVWLFFFMHQNMHKHARYAAVLVAIPAILVSESGISYLGLILAGLASLFAWRPRLILYGSLTAGLMLSVAAAVKPSFWAVQSRYVAWPMFLSFWSEHFPWWFGSGLGTFKWWGPVMQVQNGFMMKPIPRFWLWAHCDWLQIYLELGAIGLVLSLWVFFSLLGRSAKRPLLFGAAVALGAVMCGNYPLHVAPFALFVGVIVFEAFFAPGTEL